jgi:hypothetical protein
MSASVRIVQGLPWPFSGRLAGLASVVSTMAMTRRLAPGWSWVGLANLSFTYPSAERTRALVEQTRRIGVGCALEFVLPVRSALAE